MATIKDVAKLAGVSASTVSRAFSNKIFVEEETKERIFAAAKELNYHPNTLARSLREGKSFLLAFMVPDINSLFYPMLMRSIERAASEKGYSIVLCNNNEDLEVEKKNLIQMGSRGIDGLLCMSVSDNIEHLIRFREEWKIPVTLINRNIAPEISSVSIDSEYGGYLMTKYLLQQGHRKIAGFFGSPSHQRFRDRMTGYRLAMEEFGMTDYEKYCVSNVTSIEEAYQQSKNLFLGEDKPTAVFASMDILAIGIYSGLQELGLRIPEDISVVGYDNIFMTQYMTPPLTTYDNSIDQLAKEALESIQSQIEDAKNIRNINIQGKILERQSVKRLHE